MEPTVSLALSVHANKGVYAVLLGSGVSRQAGIPTGWEVVLDLVRRVAHVASDLDACDEDPVSWYRERYGAKPGYSRLLEDLAGTPAERQRLLRGYFEPTAEDREEGKKVPTDAHRSLAELVAGGYVRVVVTTNFDRLTEQAIEAAGVAPAVVSTPDAVGGAVPLAHAPCTVVKLHGDYRDTRILNTAGELGRYDAAVDALLDQILDEYGLIVCGWSAEWDDALGAAIERAPNRRFSTYWAHPRALGDRARRLVEHRGALPVPGVTADAFFRKLAEDVRSLEELAGPGPLTAKLAAQAVKRYLPEERDRIRLHDLVMDEAARVRDLAAGPNAPPLDGPFSGEILLGRMRRMEAESAKLAAMFAVAGYWTDRADRGPWIRALGLLADLPSPSGRSYVAFASLRRYPALLAAYAGGIAAVAAGRLDALGDLLLQPAVRDRSRSTSAPFVSAVNPQAVLDFDDQRRLPGCGSSLTPFSQRLWGEAGLRDALREFLPGDEEFTEAFDRFEYLAGLVGHDVGGWAPAGCFVWRGGRLGDPRTLGVVTGVAAEIDAQGDAWPLLEAGAFGGSVERLLTKKAEYDATLPRWIR